MNTVGKILRDARVKSNLSLQSLESMTKIKSDFIQKIENEDWDNLPEFPVVSGFVKNIASALNISTENTNAILRRDYPPKKLSINPKPDIENKFVWSPKTSFLIGILFFVVLVLGYLGFEYLKFIKPPEINVLSPKNDEVVTAEQVKVEGSTTTDATLTINNQPIILDQDGKFNTSLQITKETKSLIFKAVSRSGKTTEKNINIKVE